MPATTVVTWASSSTKSLARPKSDTRGSKFSSRRMLLDFMSRCTIFGQQSWCKYAIPLAEPRATLNRAPQFNDRSSGPCSKKKKTKKRRIEIRKPLHFKFYNCYVFYIGIYLDSYHAKLLLDGIPKKKIKTKQ